MGEQRSMWAFYSEMWKRRNFKDEKRTSKMKKVMGAFENFIHPILPDTRTGGVFMAGSACSRALGTAISCSAKSVNA